MNHTFLRILKLKLWYFQAANSPCKNPQFRLVIWFCIILGKALHELEPWATWAGANPAFGRNRWRTHKPMAICNCQSMHQTRKHGLLSWPAGVQKKKSTFDFKTLVMTWHYTLRYCIVKCPVLQVEHQENWLFLGGESTYEDLWPWFVKFFLDPKASQNIHTRFVRVAHQLHHNYMTVYTLLELEYRRSKCVSPRLGIALWANATVVKENL